MATTEHLLDRIPIRTRDWTADDSGRVQVLVPRYGDHHVGRWLARLIGRPHIPVRLDETGSTVWQACDGHNRVLDIAEQLHAACGGDPEELQVRLFRYLRSLERGRLIHWRDAIR